ncbi:MAG TPA: hypothetical protein VF624_06745 [Tepidisphaeraceae bacterium]|jgi:hypothetical protein
MTSLPPPHLPVAQYAHAAAAPTDDRQHLKLLAIFHYVLAGVTALFGCFPVIHVVMGVAMVSENFFPPAQGPMRGIPPGTGPGPLNNNAPPFDRSWFGWIFIVTGTLFILLAWTLAVLTLLSGLRIKAGRSRTFSMVVAGVMCAFFPFGTTLGVFTLIVLMRDSVKGLYAAGEAGSAPPTAETA